MPYGTYNNTLDDVLSSPTSEINWMGNNRLAPSGMDKTTLYISNSKVNLSTFPNAVLNSYLKKINLGVAYSTIGEVDNAIAYNNRQTDSRKKLTHVVSEYEYWNAGNVAGFRTLIQQVRAKTSSAGIKSYVYAGWGSEWDTIVQQADGLFMHCYRTTAQANTKDDLYKYCKSRLEAMAASAKKYGKIYPISIIFSAEPAFMYDYFKTHNWIDAYLTFMESYNRLATATMKQWLIMDGSVIFVSKYMKLIKP